METKRPYHEQKQIWTELNACPMPRSEGGAVYSSW